MCLDNENEVGPDLDSSLEKYVIPEALLAVAQQSYGVGGILVNLKEMKVIFQYHNTVIAREDENEHPRLKDPTAHGERQLIDWYFDNKQKKKLPEPKDILLITSLDPCCMCTGSILTAGFRVIVAALDDKAGINYDNSNRFSPFQGTELELIEKSFIYPAVVGDASRKGYGEVPFFEPKTFSRSNVDTCLKAFVDGANAARGIIGDIVPREEAKDIKELGTSPVISVLHTKYPQALEYRAENPGKPDMGLARFLVEAAKEDRKHGGDGDAVAFLDCFGNLLMCRGGRKDLSPIRTAYMETIRGYQEARYMLSRTSKNALRYLCEPKFGTFVFVKGFDRGTQSFADMGAYGSTILGAMDNPNNLQYITPRITQEELDSFISGMPPRYCSLIRPRRVEDSELIKEVEEKLR